MLRAFIYTPVIISFLVPIAIISQSIVFLTNKCFTSKSDKSKSSDEASSIQENDVIINAYLSQAKQPKSYDLVLYGATGFTGRLAALYIAKT